LALAAIRVGPGLMLVVVVIVVASLSPVFLTTRNIGNVLGQSAVIAVLALAQLLVIVTRGIDLSVGSTLALSAIVGAP
jgi:ribose transport system permease protein